MATRTAPFARTVVLLAVAACADEGRNPAAPGTPPTGARASQATLDAGTYYAGTAAAAADDPDGYTVVMSAAFSGLASGTHTVTLAGLSANCSTATPNPQTVTVGADGKATAAFDVSCTGTATTGTVRAVASTTGSSLDPDGYTVTVDGDAGSAHALAVNDSVTIAGLSPGSHTVALSGLATNCTAADNPRTVSVTAGETARAAFAVTCQFAPPPPTTGAVVVTTATSGANPDPDGYTVSVDGGTPKAVGVNGTTRFDNLAAGSHSVQLAGLATNCTAAANPRTVSVTAGADAPAEFSVACTAVGTTYTFVGAGDIAGCGFTGDEATATVLDAVVREDPNATVFVAGDIAYDSATTAEYTNCYHPTWGRHKARTYAVLGNHEYWKDPNTTWDYFGARAGERGKGYYSFDLGDWHVVMLNDNWGNGAPGWAANTAQDKWLVADLAASTKRCTIAIWHQPYVASGWGVISSRKVLWDRLYAAGAEVVITGHKHHYERLAPMNPSLARDDARGLRSFVVGTGGTPTAMPSSRVANSEVVSTVRGVLKFTLGAGTYSWQFMPVAGQTFTDSGSGTCR